LVLKQGRFGRFLACSKYPECKFTKSVSMGVKCPLPNCGGDMVERSSRGGKRFYSCSKYPKCKYAIWYQPIPKKCPQCQAPFLVVKMTKAEGKVNFCLNKECGFKESEPVSS